jgi:transposase
MQVPRLGGDLAKQSFQVHGGEAHDNVGVRQQRPRGNRLPCFAPRPPCLIGRAAGGRAHSWAREFGPRGPPVRLRAPQCVPPYRTPPQMPAMMRTPSARRGHGPRGAWCRAKRGHHQRSCPGLGLAPAS